VRRPPGHRFDPEFTLHSRIFTPSRHLFACFCSLLLRDVRGQTRRPCTARTAGAHRP
jgi:hypothetical protein